jgi:hypothetical protein
VLAVRHRPAPIPAALRARRARVHDRRRLIDLRGLGDIRSRKPRRIYAGHLHRDGGRVDRRRAGHPARDCAVIDAPRSTQLPPAHDGARA